LGALLKDTSTTTVFVTHDLSEAAQLAGQMAVIIGNRLRQVGRPEDVFAIPADEDVRGFVNHRARPGEK
jgi:ABC-type proline/glycine betaine transport system ATPase subunit